MVKVRIKARGFNFCRAAQAIQDKSQGHATRAPQGLYPEAVGALLT